MNAPSFKLVFSSLLIVLILSTACAPPSSPNEREAGSEVLPSPTGSGAGGEVSLPSPSGRGDGGEVVPETFSDPAYDFTFEYPSDWTPQPFPDNLAHGVFIYSPPLSTGPEPLIFAINVGVADTTAANVRQVVNAEIAQLPQDVASGISREAVTVGGEPAEQVIGLPSRSGDIEIFIVHRARLYHIIFQPYDPDNESIEPYLTDALRVFNNFLASFRFK